MSKFSGFIVGAITVGIGILTGNPALIIQGAAMIVLQGAVLLTMKNPARQASEMTIALGEQPRSALFGECFTAGSLVDAFNFGGKYGTDWECLIIRLADHKCHSLTGFYVNDTYVAYTGDGNYAQFENANTGRDGLHFYFRNDTSSDALPTELTDNWPGYSSGDIGQAGCDAIVFYRADKAKAKKPVWPGGRPRFGFVVKGKLCYDPRLDSTVGGSGTHRWDNPSTWQWSENAAVCRYNWVRGIYANDNITDPTQLLIGRGLSAEEAPPENIFAAANLCDETVDGSPRYRVAGPVYANQTFLEVEEMFAAATGGSVITHEGSVELEPGAAKSVVATFTDDDLIAGSKVQWNGGVLSDSDGGWVNTVVANYVEPNQQWNNHDAPVVRDEGDIITDGGPRETQISLRLVKWVNQAQRVAEITRQLGRLWGRGQVTLGPRFCELEAGDWVEWQSDRRFGGATRTFRVEAYAIDEKWQNTLTLREISAAAFGDGAVFEPDYSVATPTTPPPDVGAPDGGQWSLAAVVLTSSGVEAPALEITGDAGDDDSVEAIVFEYWKDDGVINPVTDPDDPTWSVFGTFAPETTKVEVTGVEGDTDYYAAVTYVVDGEPGERLVLGPVTTAAIDLTGAVEPIAAVAVGRLPWKDAVRARTTAALAANTYNNGTAGVGATLTGNSNGALAAQDGVTLVVNERLLVMNEATGANNGIYKVTQVGSAGSPYILTRATDADEASELVNATAFVSEGALYADTMWTCTTNAPITVGTTSLAFQEAGGGGSLTVEDEGSVEASDVTTLNFAGAGVAASDMGSGVVQINIPGGSGANAYEAVPTSVPDAAAFSTWENQGTATFTADSHGVYFEGDSDGQLHIREQNLPSTPFSYYARIDFLLASSDSITTGIYGEAGFALRNSTSGRVVTGKVRFERVAGDENIVYHAGVQRWQSVTTVNSDVATRFDNSPIRWIRIDVTSTGFTLHASKDGRRFVQVASDTFASYVTATGGSVDKFGIFARSSLTGTFHGYFDVLQTSAP
jgi:hypothetical protein